MEQLRLPLDVARDVEVGPAFPLVTDFFGTVGMQSVRGGSYAGPSGSVPPAGYTTPPTPASSEAPAGSSRPNDVKYWSF